MINSNNNKSGLPIINITRNRYSKEQFINLNLTINKNNLTMASKLLDRNKYS